MLAIAFGSIQTGFIVGFKVSPHPLALSLTTHSIGWDWIAYVQYGNIPGHHQERFVLATAILAAAMLSLGVLRHYWDIYEERTVRGISWGFVFLDALGDLASLLAIRM